MNKRDQYLEKLKLQLDIWNAEVTKWEAKTRGAQADMRAEHERQLESFRRQRGQAVEQMRKVQAATGDAWIDLVRGADDAWAKMREAFEKAQSQFQKSDTIPGRNSAPNTNPGRNSAPNTNPGRTSAPNTNPGRTTATR